MSTSDAGKIFDLGARLGSLEGYLYVGKDVEAQYLPGWLGNIEKAFGELPPDARSDCAAGFYEVMRKVAAYLEKLYGSSDANAIKAAAVVDAVKKTLR